MLGMEAKTRPNSSARMLSLASCRVRQRVVVVRFRRLATLAATALRSDIAIINVARSILRGRPRMRPPARAAASPAMVRSAISSRSSEGQVRAKANGVKLGRKPKLTPHQRRAIKRCDGGEPVRGRAQLQRARQYDFRAGGMNVLSNGDPHLKRGSDLFHQARLLKTGTEKPEIFWSMKVRRARTR